MNYLENSVFALLQNSNLTALTEARKRAIANSKDLRLSPSDRPTWRAIAVLLTKLIREY